MYRIKGLREILEHQLSLPRTFLGASWWYARAIIRKISSDDILFLASGIAFNGILTMIPILLLGAAALGALLSSSEAAVQSVHDILGAIFPPQPFATNIKDSLLTVIADIAEHRGTLGITGFFVLLYTATSLFDSVRSVLHTVYEVPRTRGVVKSLLRHLGFVTLAFLLFVASSLSIWIVSLLAGIITHVPQLSFLKVPDLDTTLPTLVVVALTTFMFYIIFRYIPDTKPPRKASLISTITTSILWVVSGKLFAFYLGSFSAIGKIYGPYAFILVLLIWVYYSSLIFILGAIAGHVYWQRTKLGGGAAVD
jgi:membrane protein